MNPGVESIASLAGSRVVAELASQQSYRRDAPSQVMIADAAAESFRPAFSRQHATLPPQCLYAIDNAVVFGKGAILLDGAVVRDNLEGAPLDKILAAAGGSARSVARVIEEPVLYTTRYGVKNYGHCLTDIVPRIVQAIRAKPDLRIALHPEFVATARSALLALGCQERQFISLDESPTLLVQGYYASPCNIHPLVHSPVAVKIIRSEFDEETLFRSSPLRADKLFVTRSDAGTRHLANHAEVAGVLKDYGFVEVAVGGMSHLEQAALFYQAREIIGLAGAALTNVLYCRGGTRMTVLAPATMPALYFWDLAAHVGVDFRIGYFPALTPTRGIHSDFSVDVSHLAGIADSRNLETDSIRARWL